MNKKFTRAAVKAAKARMEEMDIPISEWAEKYVLERSQILPCSDYYKKLAKQIADKDAIVLFNRHRNI